MSESKFRRKWCKELKTLGAVIIPYVANTRGLAGTPDLYLSHRRWRGWLEIKGVHTVLTDLQRQVAFELIHTGTMYYILRAPNLLQNVEGETIKEVKDAMDLLKTLQELSCGI